MERSLGRAPAPGAGARPIHGALGIAPGALQAPQNRSAPGERSLAGSALPLPERSIRERAPGALLLRRSMRAPGARSRSTPL